MGGSGSRLQSGLVIKRRYEPSPEAMAKALMVLLKVSINAQGEQEALAGQGKARSGVTAVEGDSQHD